MFNPITSSFFHKLQDWVHSHPSLEYQFYIKGKKIIPWPTLQTSRRIKTFKKEIKFGQLPSTNYPSWDHKTKYPIQRQQYRQLIIHSITKHYCPSNWNGQSTTWVLQPKTNSWSQSKKATQVHARYGPTKTKPKAGHHNKTSKHAALPAKKCWE